jgi:hypothetical protein
MTPKIRLALAAYTATTAAGGFIGGEPVPAGAMLFCLGYQAKAAVEQANRRTPRPSVRPVVETKRSWM